MQFSTRALTASVIIAVLGLYLGGCGSTSTETAEQDKLTAHVGQYDPPPPGISKPRVGCPPWNVQGHGSFSHDKNTDDLAADQMSTLLYKTYRFDLIERAQLQQLLKEQNLEGIVKPGELAKPGQVRGVDYLLIGKITDLSVKSEKSSKGFGLARVGGILGGFDYKDKSSKITTECGVDIRLVDPTTGTTMVASFSQYKKTDSISAFGVDILGASAEADADLKIDETNKGKILRLALDDSLRKALPDIDQFLVKRRAPANGGGTSTIDTPRNPDPAGAPKKFCGQCGTPVSTEAKFCPKCGKPVD